MARDYSRILVTGGAGFIGSHLVDRLLNECMMLAKTGWKPKYTSEQGYKTDHPITPKRAPSMRDKSRFQLDT